jgi:YD repeat-containing protein
MGPDPNQTRTWTYGYTTLANGLKVLNTLNGPGLPADGINDVTTYTYTATGDLATATDPMGLVTTVLARNTNGQPTLVEQPDLSRWSFTYDYEGRVLTAGFAGPGQTALLSTFTYNQTGQVLSYTNTRGKTWTFAYNNARRLTETTGPTGDKVTYTYDAAGNVTKEEYRNGTNPVTFWEGTDFDGLSRVLRTIGAMGQTWTYANDVEDNLTGITDPLSKTTTHAYDKLNRLISTIDRENYTTGMLYDAQDRLVEYTDPRTIKTIFTRNGFGEVVSEVSADRGTITYTYDRRGLVKTRTDARNVTVTYAYDNAGRLTLIDYPTGTIPDVAFTHDTSFQGVPANSNKGHVGRITDGIIRALLHKSREGFIL